MFFMLGLGIAGIVLAHTMYDRWQRAMMASAIAVVEREHPDVKMP